MIGRNIPFVLQDTLCDGLGWFLMIKGELGGNLFTFISVYGLYEPDLLFFRSFFQSLAGFGEGQILIGADLNVPLNRLLDKSHTTQASASHPLPETLRDVDISH